MRTLLINAPYPFAECPTLPLGLCYLAAVLEEKGHEVEILDMVVSKFSPQRIKEKIQEFKPDVCGAGPVTMNYPTALRALKVCNEMGAMTVMGGCHVTFWDEECLNEAPYIDVIVRREGEYTLLDLVEGKDLKDILGITYREDGKIVVNPDRPLIQNLDELPFPARHLLPLAKYHAYKVGASMITARGCPYHCIFCVGHKMVGAKARYRDPKLVVDEMEVIMGQGFDDICVEDDQLTMNHKHVYAICDEILNRGLKIKWCAFSRCDTVTPDLVKRMSEAGCYYFCYGAESGDDRILELARKRQTREKLRKGVKIAKDSGVKVLASFIMGLPGETPQTMKESMEFGNELDTAHGFHILSPFPGTEVRERAKEFGLRILHSNWLRYDANQAVTESDEVPKELLNKTVNDFNYNLEGLIRDQQKEVEEGTLNTPEAKEDYLLRKRRTLAWRLLKNDRIERHGKLENNGEDPKKLLADEIYSIKAVSDALSREWVEWGLTQLINEGLLECTKDDHTITWKWADIGKGKVKAKKVESKIEQRK
ncbi:MAG: radical SAM protein [Candidatus Freyarchaeum deiterrae]